MLVRADDPFKRRLFKEVGKTLTKLRIHTEERLDRLSFMGEISQFDTFSTDKVKQLLLILALEEDLQNQTDMTAIVFVQERTMAAALASLLIKLAEMQPNLYGHLKVNLLIRIRTLLHTYCSCSNFYEYHISLNNVPI